MFTIVRTKKLNSVIDTLKFVLGEYTSKGDSNNLPTLLTTGNFPSKVEEVNAYALKVREAFVNTITQLVTVYSERKSLDRTVTKMQDEYKASLDLHNQTTETLRTGADLSQKQLHDKETELEGVMETARGLRANLDKALADNKELETKLGELTTQLDEARAQIDTLNDKIAELTPVPEVADTSTIASKAKKSNGKMTTIKAKSIKKA